MKYCYSCGKKIPTSNSFCPYCGAKQPTIKSKSSPRKPSENISSDVSNNKDVVHFNINKLKNIYVGIIVTGIDFLLSFFLLIQVLPESFNQCNATISSYGFVIIVVNLINIVGNLVDINNEINIHGTKSAGIVSIISCIFTTIALLESLNMLNYSTPIGVLYTFSLILLLYSLIRYTFNINK